MHPGEVPVSRQDLELTARLVGLPMPELWSRYLAVGGSSSLQALTERITGTGTWSYQEDLFLAVALNDAMIDESLESFGPLGALLAGQASDGQAPDGPSTTPVGATPGVGAEADDVGPGGRCRLGAGGAGR
jgi:hypothetical protein